MIIISHRGNLTGPHSATENLPSSVDHAISLGLNVEIDLWVSEDKTLHLGHDHSEYEVTCSWIVDRNTWLWIHCKNMLALEYATTYLTDTNYFFHQNDDYTLTSKGFVWVYPGVTTPKNSIAVLPESTDRWLSNLDDYKDLYGVCTDFPNALLERRGTL